LVADGFENAKLMEVPDKVLAPVAGADEGDVRREGWGVRGHEIFPVLDHLQKFLVFFIARLLKNALKTDLLSSASFLWPVHVAYLQNKGSCIWIHRLKQGWDYHNNCNGICSVFPNTVLL
jgi:hypothetical protein